MMPRHAPAMTPIRARAAAIRFIDDVAAVTLSCYVAIADENSATARDADIATMILITSTAAAILLRYASRARYLLLSITLMLRVAATTLMPP